MAQKITYLCLEFHGPKIDGLYVAKESLFVYNGTAGNETMYQINNQYEPST